MRDAELKSSPGWKANLTHSYSGEIEVFLDHAIGTRIDEDDDEQFATIASESFESRNDKKSLPDIDTDKYAAKPKTSSARLSKIIDYKSKKLNEKERECSYLEKKCYSLQKEVADKDIEIKNNEERYQKLKNELETTRGQLDAIKSDVEVNKGAMIMLAKDLKSQSKKMSIRESDYRKIEDKYLVLLKETQLKEDEAHKKSQSLKEAEERLNSTIKELEKLTSDESSKFRLEKISAELEAATIELRTKEDELAELKQKYALDQETLANLQNELELKKTMEDELRETRGSVTNLQTVMDLKQTEIKKYLLVVEETEYKLNSKEEELETYKLEYIQTKSAAYELSENLKEKATKLQTTEMKFEQLNKKYLDLKAESETKTAEIEKDMKMIDEMKSHLSSAKQSLENYKQTSDDAKSALAALTELHESKCHALEAKERDYATLQTQLETHQAQNQQLRSNLLSLTQQLETNTNELNARTEAYAALEARHHHDQQKLVDLRKDLERSKRTERELLHTRGSIGGLQAELIAKEMQVEENQSLLSDARSRLTATEEALLHSRKETEDARRSTTNLAARLSDRERELAAVTASRDEWKSNHEESCRRNEERMAAMEEETSTREGEIIETKELLQSRKREVGVMQSEVTDLRKRLRLVIDERDALVTTCAELKRRCDENEPATTEKMMNGGGTHKSRGNVFAKVAKSNTISSAKGKKSNATKNYFKKKVDGKLIAWRGVAATSLVVLLAMIPLRRMTR